MSYAIPANFSEDEIRAITRRFTAAIAPLIGPEQDIPAPDVGTNAAVMGWMMDTYSMLKGHCVHGLVTGKPIAWRSAWKKRGYRARRYVHRQECTRRKKEFLHKAPPWLSREWEMSAA